ncbi:MULTISPECIES: hypothetical protein [unclassified Mesorhizobium]|uniref:hypothetical protein n=1 Tax=unclassified Mesorhizobium TaxID=325217 RepID=UPI0003CE15CF|nr:MULTISPECIES: hypothetical protein [unclassified Mesorhizobium]ESY58296.1 hypothetical protein X745_04155 [Mesorhizobium sp. LNJC374B00]ESY59430.1 hypothetical protein X744_12795 [Mesorhizobium sp. LNJC372A00]WJI79499.1 hypothetical protein NLY34_21880 [Mesorhizobium sp. C374B]WJI86034.1 hypothetical protein NLY42_24275 [Mesorhizobium sp. C372A]
MTDLERASARPHSHASARQRLADAHKSMTKAAIGAHALDLADELERMHEAFGYAANGMNAAAAAVGSQDKMVRLMKANIRKASALFKDGKKREARELLSRMAADPDPDEFKLPPVMQVKWSTEIFRPAEPKEAKH